MELSDKSQLGQFFTTNYKEIIFEDFEIFCEKFDKNKIIIDPFAGACDLVSDKFFENCLLELYDIDKNLIRENEKNIEGKKSMKFKISLRNTLLNPPSYAGKFILTNPPYLGKNKCKTEDGKKIFELYKYEDLASDDLYKCFLISIIEQRRKGENTEFYFCGLIIIPINFWCSIRKNDINLRKEFLKLFEVILLKIFEYPVFNDTDTAICSFYFKQKEREKENAKSKIKCLIVNKLSKNSSNLIFSEKNNYCIFGKIHLIKIPTDIIISRATSQNKDKLNTKLQIKCIDDKELINMEIVDNPYIDETKNLTARSYISLIIIPEITIEKQKILCAKFNRFLTKYRKKYNSLFLTNYRENARKRISFELIYKIVYYILKS